MLRQDRMPDGLGSGSWSAGTEVGSLRPMPTFASPSAAFRIFRSEGLT